jgi:hypothetical protein
MLILIFLMSFSCGKDNSNALRKNAETISKISEFKNIVDMHEQNSDDKETKLKLASYSRYLEEKIDLYKSNKKLDIAYDIEFQQKSLTIISEIQEIEKNIKKDDQKNEQLDLDQESGKKLLIIAEELSQIIDIFEKNSDDKETKLKLASYSRYFEEKIDLYKSNKKLDITYDVEFRQKSLTIISEMQKIEKNIKKDDQKNDKLDLDQELGKKLLIIAEELSQINGYKDKNSIYALREEEMIQLPRSEEQEAFYNYINEKSYENTKNNALIKQSKKLIKKLSSYGIGNRTIINKDGLDCLTEYLLMCDTEEFKELFDFYMSEYEKIKLHYGYKNIDSKKQYKLNEDFWYSYYDLIRKSLNSYCHITENKNKSKKIEKNKKIILKNIYTNLSKMLERMEEYKLSCQYKINGSINKSYHFVEYIYKVYEKLSDDIESDKKIKELLQKYKITDLLKEYKPQNS